ncbi:FtsX-like permease family protein [uncultured Microbacterium sp.]|uniref:ABC transporter permease n=1 Tax=uncultured Microbacterium sp. TaxID=191216 RepID=UPI0025D9BE9C|nr:FtsX-like permease family protein [uncultured Microbacterium sp.]
MLALLREAVLTARSYKTASVITVLTIVAMMVAVMLTTGRSVGASNSVLGTIDSAGSRSILIRADSDAGVTSDVVARLRSLADVEWVAAFSPVTDATNAAILDGPRVPLRYIYTDSTGALGVPALHIKQVPSAWASPQALDLLGMDQPAGAVTEVHGRTFGVVAELTTPDYLKQFEPLLLAPRDASANETVGTIIVIANAPETVGAVSSAALSLVAPENPASVTVQTSSALADLRAVIESQLGSFSKGLVVALLGLAGLVISVVLYGLVMMRRKDFGRRRALGATRGLIVSLIILQTALLSALGAAVGVGASLVILVAGGDPLPDAPFVVGTAILTVAVSVGAAVLPGIAASQRDPIRELRVA